MGVKRVSGTVKDGILLLFGIIILSPKLLFFGGITMVILNFGGD